MTSITKFSLPHFAVADDPETWFNVTEQIFASQRILTEHEKFGFLLQGLTHRDISHIKDIVNSSTSADKYTQAKNRLISRYGQSEEDKIRQLLEGATIHSDTLPSVMLHEFRQLADTSESVLRGIWLKKLPVKIREGIAAWSKKSLHEQAEVADLLYKTYREDTHVNPPSVAAVSTPTDLRIDNLYALLQQIQLQVAALTTERESRSRNKSPSYRYGNRSRSRSNSGYRFKPKVLNEVCTYHYKYKDRAYRCMPGCKYYQKKEN